MELLSKIFLFKSHADQFQCAHSESHGTATWWSSGHPRALQERYESEKGTLLLTTECLSYSSANTFLHRSLHFFCKGYMDPTHRGDTTPCRLACQSVDHLFTYNMFHICFANIASGVLVQLCVKWMRFLCEHLNRKPKEQENEHLWQKHSCGDEKPGFQRR